MYFAKLCKGSLITTDLSELMHISGGCGVLEMKHQASKKTKTDHLGPAGRKKKKKHFGLSSQMARPGNTDD